MVYHLLLTQDLMRVCIALRSSIANLIALHVKNEIILPQKSASHHYLIFSFISFREKAILISFFSEEILTGEPLEFYLRFIKPAFCIKLYDGIAKEEVFGRPIW